MAEGYTGILRTFEGVKSYLKKSRAPLVFGGLKPTTDTVQKD